MVDWLGPTLLTSNILFGGEPFGKRYRFLVMPRANQTLLCFGFIYHMDDQDDSVTVAVEQVQQVVEEEWFISVVQRTDSYNAIVVLAHMN